MSRYKDIIFDLDGTLIDSRKGILSAAQAAIRSVDGAERGFSVEVIGPPLRDMLKSIVPDFSEAMLDKAVLEFRRSYDDGYWKQYEAYEGVEETLRFFSSRNIALHIATNKPQIPALKICEDLGVTGLMKSIRCFDPARHTKKEDFLQDFLGSRKTTLFVGDTKSDFRVAGSLGVDFIYCSYGFGQLDSDCMKIANFYEIKRYIK